MAIPRWNIVRRADPDDTALFDQELEEDPLILFHATPASNLLSIEANGFRSAADLGIVDGLNSVSYSKSSTYWNLVTEYPAKADFVMFAVRFNTLNQVGIRVNPSDVHVDNWREIRPQILGYCEIPCGYCHPQTR